MIRWISDDIGTAAFGSIDAATNNAYLLDVRDLVDKAGNTVAAIREKLDEALEKRRVGRSVVVCCDYGMSRSSAIAAGLIALERGITYDAAVSEVMAATGEAAIRIEVLGAVRAALERRPGVPASRGRRSILVTGASGFLGSQLVERLAASNDVAAPTRKDVDLTSGLVALERIAREREADTLVHLANPLVYTTSESLGAMLVSLKNVLDVCLAHDIHLVFPSTWEVFGGYRTTYLRADESLAPCAASSYGHAKLLCERLIRQMDARGSVRHTLLRVSPVYGPTGSRPKFIWNFIGKALREERITTHRYRNGEPALDLLHVEDAITALLAAVERRPAETLHIGTGVLTSTSNVARLIVSLTGSVSRVEQQEIHDDVANIAFDATRARARLDWAPTRPLSDGLGELVEIASRTAPLPAGVSTADRP